MAERILVVDDEAAMRRMLSRVLGSLDYECDLAASVPEAYELLAAVHYDLVVCDLKMPGQNGMALVSELERSDREIAILMVTVEDDPETARAAAGHGVDGYLVKPFTNNELQINVEYALEQSRRRKERQRDTERSLREARERAGVVRSALVDVAHGSRLIEDRHVRMLERLSEAVGKRDVETGAHIRRIGRNAGTLAGCLGLPEAEAESIGLAAPMHDVGKVAVPDAILLKPGPLTPGEREVVERHTQVGHVILSESGSPLLDLAATIALTHHERVDGRGYPDGVRGEDIPISGRIVATVDVFDALTGERPYREAMSVDQAVEVMREGRGTQFDAGVLDCFLENLDRFESPSPDSP